MKTTKKLPVDNFTWILSDAAYDAFIRPYTWRLLNS